MRRSTTFLFCFKHESSTQYGQIAFDLPCLGAIMASWMPVSMVMFCNRYTVHNGNTWRVYGLKDRRRRLFVEVRRCRAREGVADISISVRSRSVAEYGQGRSIVGYSILSFAFHLHFKGTRHWMMITKEPTRDNDSLFTPLSKPLLCVLVLTMVVLVDEE
jgi:hypothetical protein